MNIDERIKRELESTAAEIDRIIIQDDGLFEKLTGIFEGSHRFLEAVAVFYTFVFAVAAFISAYFFYTAGGLEQQLFWGVVFLTTLLVSATIKLWTFMQMNKVSTLREIKRVELAIANLEARLAIQG
ncbi:MAG: hypothetical protein O7G84_19180 [Gammaproteobacteria bacterium]|nr:hypothetical protein [Gammaproteobacteria bacterium]